jgi:hypothetical protein
VIDRARAEHLVGRGEHAAGADEVGLAVAAQELDRRAHDAGVRRDDRFEPWQRDVQRRRLDR